MRPEIPGGGGRKGKKRARVAGHSPQLGLRDPRRLHQGRDEDQGQALGFDESGRPKVKIKAGSPLRITPENELDVSFAEAAPSEVNITSTFVGGGGGGGPQGPQGPRGPQGQNGEQGIPGVPGPTGFDGEDGEDGFPGPPGRAGIAGLMGPVGSSGEDGEDGNPGPPGRDGAAGSVGSAGGQGPVGPAGPVGDEGEPGESGPPGRVGTAGAQGSTGAIGPRGFDGDDGEDGVAGPPGRQGVDGAAGAAGAAGTAGPRGSPGEAGEDGEGGGYTGSIVPARDLEYTPGKFIRADDIRITTSLFKQRHRQLLPRFVASGSAPVIDAVGMPVPTISGVVAGATPFTQLILGNAFCVIRFLGLGNAGAGAYAMYLDTGTPVNSGGVLRLGFNATCGWMIQTGVVHTGLRMWTGLTNRDLHTIGTPATGANFAAVAAFRYDTGVDTANTNWRAVTSAVSGSTVTGVTVTDTGVDAAVNATGFAFVITTTASSVTFWINGTIVAVHTTNLPIDLNLGHTVSVTKLDAINGAAGNKRIEWGRSFYFHSEFGF